MIAKEYISRYVHPDAQAFAKVVVSYALKGTHIFIMPDATVPDNDDRNVTVLIEIDTDAMPPILIVDHNCKDGWVCVDHPDYPEGHDRCYGGSNPCPYPTCEVSGQPPTEDTSNVLDSRGLSIKLCVPRH